MGDLRITDEGIAMDEDSKAKFLGDVYVASIKSTEVRFYVPFPFSCERHSNSALFFFPFSQSRCFSNRPVK